MDIQENFKFTSVWKVVKDGTLSVRAILVMLIVKEVVIVMSYNYTVQSYMYSIIFLIETEVNCNLIVLVAPSTGQPRLLHTTLTHAHFYCYGYESSLSHCELTNTGQCPPSQSGLSIHNIEYSYNNGVNVVFY